MANSKILRSGDWIIDGRTWLNVRTGRRLPIIQGGGPAVSVQESFWFRNDDGSLTTATYMGSQESNQTIATATKFRIRFLVMETGGNNFVFDPDIWYSHNGGFYYSTTTTTNVLQRVDDDNSITSGATISSSDLSGGSGDWVNGRYWDIGTPASITLNEQHSECEVCLSIVDEDVSNGDTIDLRLRDAGTQFDVYTVTPRITVSKGGEPPAAASLLAMLGVG